MIQCDRSSVYVKQCTPPSFFFGDLRPTSPHLWQTPFFLASPPLGFVPFPWPFFPFPLPLEASPNWRSPSRVGFRDSKVAHRGRQIQGTCESTNEGFGRSSPDCASGRGETPDPTTEMLDYIQEDSLLPFSRRRVRRRDSDNEDALVRDGESPGVPRHHADGWCWSHPRKWIQCPPTVPDSMDSPSRRRRRVPHSEGTHRGHQQWRKVPYTTI